MSSRPYRSKLRAEAAGETRTRIVAAAAELLSAMPYEPFSLASVATKAGVTRLTVYNQFGGRRALLEAVFDQTASEAGLDRLGEALATPDPREALAAVVERFCVFWGERRQLLLRLQAARVVDSDLDEALHERNERRRRLLRVILDRLAERGEVKAECVTDLADILQVLTSLNVFADLAEGRDAKLVHQFIWQMSKDALEHARP